MPTFETINRFRKDFARLPVADRVRFERVVKERFVADLAKDTFRAGLRVQAIQGADRIFEMTWAPNGRATFQYGDEQVRGEPHIIWRRVGTHDVFDRPPGP